ncbi:extracellular solute-binding protein [Ethanoligenens harbinense]|uniref:Binding-protein-dependent transport systems inner membrane component n=1 Tax=Ethanoligenens harbinense (strain DSM 18485 / JCM 12961 / CGMCC 1.5033 / YUAN-3) TaxID=663278 RepID=E6U9H2_ETHHY|nr:extracellular solute-binding protein [Ethanoligenens harbinense]ADU26163.1 binding-protein-dependent transport systems inner membrane component [Ethanoligenens harbinense YUAN-3]AVQ95302.1 spermidine/putrescine ABC transporter permease [Ethanoligenens harbinense YUAN-3]AYF37966.1 spermidine/putrescine ABC transporter permease [Ethanoligenens harbinense]AYF40713.1 spermidine/putrescine ABC transporter permease [Ethanoligenens harbinense]QCN91546.1 extracellular solute-binding protein [Ethano
MHGQTRETFRRKSGAVYCGLIYAFLFLPIAVIIINSFNANTFKPYFRWTGFTFDWYVKLFQNTGLLQSFGNTIFLALATTVLSVMIGTVAAVGIYKFRFRGKDIINGLLYIPVVIPEIVLGIALLSLFSKVGIPLGMLSLLLAHVTFCIPYVIFNVRARLDGYDRSIEEASMDLGATRLHTFLRITLPVLAPGIGGGALLAFTLSIDDVIISYFTNGQTMTFPLKVMASIKSGVAPDVNALSTLILLVTTGVVALVQTGLLKKFVGKVGTALSALFYIGRDELDTKQRAVRRRRGVGTALAIAIVAGVLLSVGKNAGTSAVGRNGQLNLFIWTEYVPDSVIQNFEKETGIQVNVSNYSSNEDMLAKVKSEKAGAFDIVQPTDYMVQQMIGQGLLQKLDKSALTNMKNIGSSYLNQYYDPNNNYSVPYLGGVAAIAVNTQKIKDRITGYADLFNPKYKNSIVSLDDYRAVIGMTARSLGMSMNETDSAKLDEIKTQLMKLKGNIKLYDSDSPKSALISGDATLGFCWNAEITLAMEENPAIKIVFPKEGAYVFVDNWCITKGAKNVRQATAFINYMLKAETAKEVSEEYPYMQPNAAAVELLGSAYKNNPARNVPQDVIKKGEHVANLDVNTLARYDAMWTDLKK